MEKIVFVGRAFLCLLVLAAVVGATVLCAGGINWFLVLLTGGRG